jgi:hypothetical protein
MERVRRISPYDVKMITDLLGNLTLDEKMQLDTVKADSQFIHFIYGVREATCKQKYDRLTPQDIRMLNHQFRFLVNNLDAELESQKRQLGRFKSDFDQQQIRQNIQQIIAAKNGNRIAFFEYYYNQELTENQTDAITFQL